ncbi:MAG: hypothetical protein JWO38_4977 [Gemmataceae bacterium]|nr:hypothetical protein [Gemmataceae bacterium]
MMTTAGHFDHDGLPRPTDDRCPRLPEGVEDSGPDDLADWWLDLGCGD